MTIHLRLATMLLAVVAIPSFAATSGPSSTVVYVGGNDLVIKAASGKLLNYAVPAGYGFTDSGKPATLEQLKPGDKLTAVVDTGTDPQVVASIAVVKTKVFSATPPNLLTISSPEGALNVIVPLGTKFSVDGKTVGLSDLSSGMMLEATVITPAREGEEPSTTPATPPLSGVLLVAKLEDLPATGTRLPLYGLVGGLMLLVGFALLRGRKAGSPA
jgi:LPXTG-motif cell wall-anchored protein